MEVVTVPYCNLLHLQKYQNTESAYKYPYTCRYRFLKISKILEEIKTLKIIFKRISLIDLKIVGSSTDKIYNLWYFISD